MQSKFRIGMLVKIQNSTEKEGVWGGPFSYGEITGILTEAIGFLYKLNNGEFIKESDIIMAYTPIAQTKPKTKKRTMTRKANLSRAIDTMDMPSSTTEDTQSSQVQVQ